MAGNRGQRLRDGAVPHRTTPPISSASRGVWSRSRRPGGRSWADLLNISRPTLVRLRTDGEIPYTMRGPHRRVRLRDILDYSDRTRPSAALDQMAADADDDGLYEATTGS